MQEFTTVLFHRKNMKKKYPQKSMQDILARKHVGVQSKLAHKQGAREHVRHVGM